MDLLAGIAVHVMPCHDCRTYSKHLCIVYHDACETIFCILYNAVFVYLYLYGLWPEIKYNYYYYYLCPHNSVVVVLAILYVMMFHTSVFVIVGMIAHYHSDQTECSRI